MNEKAAVHQTIASAQQLQVAPVLQRTAIRASEQSESAEISTQGASFSPDFSQIPVRANPDSCTGLPPRLRAGVEQLSGLSMANVRVHYNSSKPAQVGALAYTQGSAIHLAAGQERHLPHEAWHVVQQKQGRVPPTLTAHGVSINADRKLEAESDSKARALEHLNQSHQASFNSTPAQSSDNSAVVQRQVVDSSGDSITDLEEIEKYLKGQGIDLETSEREELESYFVKEGKRERRLSIEEFLINCGYISKMPEDPEEEEEEAEFSEEEKPKKRKQEEAETKEAKKPKVKDPERQKIAKEGFKRRAVFGNKVLNALSKKTAQQMHLKTGSSNNIIAIEGKTGKRGKIVKKARGPRKFDDRGEQSRRQIATVVFKDVRSVLIQEGLRKGQPEYSPEEIQVAKKEGGNLGISSNTNASNEYIRKTFRSVEDVKKSARAIIETGQFKSDSEAIRALRHCAKLLRNKYDTLKDFGQLEVPPKVEASEDGLHAELRLTDVGYVEPIGVKRPCVGCAISLKDKGIEVKTTGPFWVSEASLKRVFKLAKIKPGTKIDDLTPEQIDQIADLAKDFMSKSYLTENTHKHLEPTADHGSDSEVDPTDWTDLREL